MMIPHSMVGSRVAAMLVGIVGEANLLPIPAVLLVGALLVYLSMERSFRSFNTETKDVANGGNATGGNPFAGFTAVFKSKYLFSICLFGIFWATCATPVYFQQAEIVKATFQDAPYDASLISDADSLLTAFRPNNWRQNTQPFKRLLRVKRVPDTLLTLVWLCLV